jgi:hypothetical protein
VRALEDSPVLGRLGAEVRIAGAGMAAEEVRAEIRSDRVRMLGLLLPDELEHELTRPPGGRREEAWMATGRRVKRLRDLVAQIESRSCDAEPDS